MRLPTPKQTVLYRPVDGGAVLLSVNDEVYYGLNAVGSFVWEHLPPILHTLDELVADLATEYPDVPAATIRADVIELLDDLIRNGLLAAPDGTSDGKNQARAEQTPQSAAQGLG